MLHIMYVEVIPVNPDLIRDFKKIPFLTSSYYETKRGRCEQKVMGLILE